jgi:hypothetical protein
LILSIPKISNQGTRNSNWYKISFKRDCRNQCNRSKSSLNLNLIRLHLICSPSLGHQQNNNIHCYPWLKNSPISDKPATLVKWKRSPLKTLYQGLRRKWSQQRRAFKSKMILTTRNKANMKEHQRNQLCAMLMSLLILYPTSLFHFTRNLFKSYLPESTRWICFSKQLISSPKIWKCLEKINSPRFYKNWII